MLSKLTWPGAAVIISIVVVVGATVLAGPTLGVSDEILKYVTGGEAVVAAITTWLMRSPREAS